MPDIFEGTKKLIENTSRSAIISDSDHQVHAHWLNFDLTGSLGRDDNLFDNCCIVLNPIDDFRPEVSLIPGVDVFTVKAIERRQLVD